MSLAIVGLSHLPNSVSGCSSVFKQDCTPTAFDKPIACEASLQLLLFIDERPSSRKQLEQVNAYLELHRSQSVFELQVIEVGAQPYLAEHFKLVATPALVKIYPEPRQTLAGSNLVMQLKNWWPRWQKGLQENVEQPPPSPSVTQHPETTPEPPAKLPIPSVAHSAELIQLSDEVFRLKKEQEALIEQLQFKDRVIAMLAHDLRSPLTAASLGLETLELAFRNESEGSTRLPPHLMEQLLKQSRSQLKVMDRMITDILQAARGTSAELHIQPQKLDLGGLCHEVLNSLRHRLQGKHQALKTDIPLDLPCVYADEERVRQVMVNLLDNAIKYTPEQGTIHVAILHRTTQKIQVSIYDNGPGIPVENLDRVFEERFRLQRDASQDGYGIGLALCQRIIRAHYGRIWVESSDKGSCFHFTLPVYP